MARRVENVPDHSEPTNNKKSLPVATDDGNFGFIFIVKTPCQLALFCTHFDNMASNVISKKIQLAPGRKKNCALILDCFRDVTKMKQFWNKWITTDLWIEIINDRYAIDEALKFTGKELSGAISRNGSYKSNQIDATTMPNGLGIYKASRKRRDGFKKMVTTTAYFATTPNVLPSQPGGNTTWYSNMSTFHNVDTRREPTTTENKRSLPSGGQMLATTSAPVAKKRRGEVAIRSGSNGQFVVADPVMAMRKARLPHSKGRAIDHVAAAPSVTSTALESSAIQNETWWDSPEAWKLFGELVSANAEEEETQDDNQLTIFDLRRTVGRRIKRLRKGYTTSDGWRNVIDDYDSQGLCTGPDIFNVQMKCRYLVVALQVALYDMPSRTWGGCCKEAVRIVNAREGDEHISNGETARIWHLAFRSNNESFRNPTMFRRHGKPPLPPLLDANPEFAQSLIAYCKKNLNDLSAEKVLTYLHMIALPALLEERRRELGDSGDPDCEFGMPELFRENRLTKLTLETVYRWFHRLGFKYEARKKGYYVDTHEKPETVVYCRHFLKRYLAYEIRMHRWVQLPLSQLKQMEERKEIATGLGYHYKDDQTKLDMVEFHVDEHVSFQDLASTTGMYGGNLSVRKMPGDRPIISFGQDECIFKQNTFSPKAWTAPDGTKGMIPKDDGLGVMISTFVSREFGFGYELSGEDLQKVNKEREGNKQYSDEEAATKVKGNTKKQALTASPFVLEFEYGANNEGYWDYDHMVLQFEDCIDVVNVLLPQFEVLFLFDHSCGHDRKRPDGLSAPKMNKGFGGAQPKMRRSKLETADYLGRFDGILAVGDVQDMWYQEGDVGPFYYTNEQQEYTKQDRPTGKWKEGVDRKKKDLQKALEAIGVSAKGNRKALAALCRQNNIPCVERIEIVVEGWAGKPKGMLQILWERGFIDPAVDANKAEKYFTNDGKKDAFGNLIEGTSLRKMVKELFDFVEEETLLQYHARLLGVIVDRTPKCHPEIAGEGVEYSWGCAKGTYRRLPFAEKKRKLSVVGSQMFGPICFNN